MMLNTPTFANNFDFIWIFSLIKSLSCNKRLNVLVYVLCLNRMSLHKRFTQNVQN